jgi:hypothetical protein
MQRNRTQIADTILGFFASTAAALAVSGGVQRNELFDRYAAKLSSYNNDVVRFTFATLPALLAMAFIFIVYKTLESLNVEHPSRQSVFNER